MNYINYTSATRDGAQVKHGPWLYTDIILKLIISQLKETVSIVTSDQSFEAMLSYEICIYTWVEMIRFVLPMYVPCYSSRTVLDGRAASENQATFVCCDNLSIREISFALAVVVLVLTTWHIRSALAITEGCHAKSGYFPPNPVDLTRRQCYKESSRV